MMSLAMALQTIAAFNLVCAGTLRTGPVGLALPESQGEAFDIVFHVDLTARSWCTDACESREPIASVGDGYIVLRDRSAASGSHVITLFPSAGRFTDTLIEGDQATLRSGRCLPSGFDNVRGRIA
jgi:hypothetical protein